MRFCALLLPREIGIFGECIFFCLLWKMSPHLCVVAVGEVDARLHYCHILELKQ